MSSPASSQMIRSVIRTLVDHKIPIHPNDKEKLERSLRMALMREAAGGSLELLTDEDGDRIYVPVTEGTSTEKEALEFMLLRSQQDGWFPALDTTEQPKPKRFFYSLNEEEERYQPCGFGDKGATEFWVFEEARYHDG